jgi:hypothetical protein
VNPNSAYGQVLYSADEDFPDGYAEMMDAAYPYAESAPATPKSTPLGSRDALVFLMCSPPESRYFAFDMDVSYRFTPQPYYPAMNFGDAASNLSVEWSTQINAIQAFDAGTLADIFQALEASAGSETPVLVQSLNASLLRFWNDHESTGDSMPDSLTSMVRWSLPIGGTTSADVQRYLLMRWPVLLVRMNGTASELLSSFEEFPEIPLKQKRLAFLLRS